MSNPNSEDDARLVRRVAGGDEKALQVLVDRHQGLLVRLCFGILQDHEEAEDVASWAFVKFWQTASQFRGDCSIKAYLCRIALNLSRDRLARLPVSLSLTDDLSARETTATDPRWDRIEMGLRSLSAEDRELLTLHYLDDLSYSELEVVLGANYSVLKTRLVRARERLREVLGLNDECRKA